MKLSRIMRISRPRFWLYEAGTFAVGVVAAYSSSAGGTMTASVFYSIPVVGFFMYFLFSANLYIYGINDIYDYETDKLNPKKVAYEALVMPDEHARLWRAILVATIPFLLLFLIINASLSAIIAFGLFLFCAAFYSAPPIRAKAIPGFDSIFSAGHYVATGAFGYLLAGGQNFSYVPVLAAMCWATAMHAYSAVPDIQADKDGGIDTIATALGGARTISLCAILYMLAAVLSFPYLGVSALLLGTIYLLLMLMSFNVRNSPFLFQIYKIFPILNALAGMAIFFLVLFR